MSSMPRTVDRPHTEPAEFPVRSALNPARSSCFPDTGENKLGEREREVMGVLWDHGSSTVQQVARRLSVSLAYTTVMTTLDRLFKKGLAHREKHDRAFLYSAAMTQEDMERKRAANLVQRFFADSSAQQNLLLSHLVDAVHRYDTELLDQLEDEIRSARSRHQVPQETP
jgi:predicted transcriptional regulator